MILRKTYVKKLTKKISELETRIAMLETKQDILLEAVHELQKENKNASR